eukprot:scaffold30522_cov18-Tisochrysis_lutea.AAC.1
MAGYEDYGEEFYPEDEFYGGEVGRCDNVEIMRDLEEWSSGMWVGVLVCVPGSAANSYVFCVAKEGLQLPGALHGMKGMALEHTQRTFKNTRVCALGAPVPQLQVPVACHMAQVAGKACIHPSSE